MTFIQYLTLKVRTGRYQDKMSRIDNLGMYESLAFDLHYYCSTLQTLSLPILDNIDA